MLILIKLKIYELLRGISALQVWEILSSLLQLFQLLLKGFNIRQGKFKRQMLTMEKICQFSLYQINKVIILPEHGALFDKSCLTIPGHGALFGKLSDCRCGAFYL